jgi:cytoskeletal protein RodZ
MLTVGQILRKAREQKNVSIQDVAHITKIKQDYLEKLEKNEFTGFVSSTFIKGFIRSYANYLELETENLVALYRRQVGEEEKPIKADDNKRIKTEGFVVTPIHIIGTGLVVFFVGLIAYLINQFYQLQQPPRLEFASPAQQQVETTAKNFEVKGFTEEQVIVTFNGSQVQLKPDRTFSIVTDLKPGENVLTFEAWKQFSEDKKTKKTFVVKYNDGTAQSNTPTVAGTNTNTQNNPAPAESTFAVTSTDEAWIQVVADNIQQAVGVVPKNYNREFKTKTTFYVTTGKPRQTKLILNGEAKEWTIKNGVGSLTCNLNGQNWDCK